MVVRQTTDGRASSDDANVDGGGFVYDIFVADKIVRYFS